MSLFSSLVVIHSSRNSNFNREDNFLYSLFFEKLEGKQKKSGANGAKWYPTRNHLMNEGSLVRLSSEARWGLEAGPSLLGWKTMGAFQLPGPAPTETRIAHVSEPRREIAGGFARVSAQHAHEARNVVGGSVFYHFHPVGPFEIGFDQMENRIHNELFAFDLRKRRFEAN